ncbi:MAG: CoA transferase [Acidimicrobiales bacterium]
MTVVGVDEDQARAWAASGAMALTGHPTRTPLGPPLGLVPKLVGLADRITSVAAHLGGELHVDALSLLAERAAVSGLHRGGGISCGGSTRLIQAGERWVAITLAREDDIDLVPAWLELDAPCEDPWLAVDNAMSSKRLETLVGRALLLGLPVGVLPLPEGAMADRPPVRRLSVTGGSSEPAPLAGIVVADLTALWAGPLCGALLAAAGATVIKIEAVARPDGARLGPPAFFDLLNAGKQSVALDLRTNDGVQSLRTIVGTSDVVLEASRPRALEQLGIDAADVVAHGRTRVWASITGHGRTGAGRERVAFGDDAAVAGGLVCWDESGRPVFCADAIADPTSGLVAATAVLDALAGDGRWVLDISMAAVAADFAGPTLPASSFEVAAPRARAAGAPGPSLGQHTASVMAGLTR